MSLFENAARYYRNQGLSRALQRVLAYPWLRFRRSRFKKSLKGKDAGIVFQSIYKENIWGEVESRSGAGSALVSTKNVRANLPVLFEKYGVRTFLDAPCGDFNWMQHVPLPAGTSYIGGDIVPDIVKSNQEKFADTQHSFLALNIIEQPLPDADLMLCRDCLIHLSYNDIRRFLENFVRSNIPLLLTTTHTETSTFKNKDIQTGDFRPIDLFSAPFFFPKDVLYRFDDRIPHSRPRDLCLWRKDQIAAALEVARAAII